MNENNIRDKLKIEQEKRNKILELQNKLENGEISEKQLSKQEAKELEQLYESQIKELNINIELKKKELSSKINKVNELYKKAIVMKSKKYKEEYLF